MVRGEKLVIPAFQLKQSVMMEFSSEINRKNAETGTSNSGGEIDASITTADDAPPLLLWLWSDLVAEVNPFDTLYLSHGGYAK